MGGVRRTVRWRRGGDPSQALSTLIASSSTNGAWKGWGSGEVACCCLQFSIINSKGGLREFMVKARLMVNQLQTMAGPNDDYLGIFNKHQES